MADRLTQLQDCLDQLLAQMYATIRYIDTRHAYAHIPGQADQFADPSSSSADPSQPTQQPAPSAAAAAPTPADAGAPPPLAGGEGAEQEPTRSPTGCPASAAAAGARGRRRGCASWPRGWPRSTARPPRGRRGGRCSSGGWRGGSPTG
jgi:hypothetical protein